MLLGLRPQSLIQVKRTLGKGKDRIDGRNRRAVRPLTSARLAEIETKLPELLSRCRTTGQSHACLIIEALGGRSGRP